MKFIPVPIGSYFGVKLDISDLDIEQKDRLEPFLTFNVKTFTILGSDGDKPESFNIVFGAPNWYFDHASDEAKKKIAEFFAISCQMIRMNSIESATPATRFTDFVMKLGEMYMSIVESCNLIEEFRHYADTHVQLQDISGYGDRPQDSKELTFSVEQMRELMSLAHLSKLVAPIFGELVMNIPDLRKEPRSARRGTIPKEMRIVPFLSPIIDKYYHELDDKLRYYIEHIVKTKCKDSNNAAAVFSGLIDSTRVEWIRAVALVRNFVLCQLEREDSNIVRFIDTVAHTHITNQKNFANKNQVQTRKPISAFGGEEDSDNVSQMEIDSVVSLRPLDTQAIVTVAVNRAVQDVLVQRQITYDELEECYQYLMRHPIIPTPLNRLMVCAIFGDKLGGGRGVDLLERGSYTRLVCLLQMIAFQTGLNELGHALTASKTNAVRVTRNAEETKFELNYATSGAYRNCREKFSGSSRAFDGSEWDKQMKIVADDLLQTCYTYNTPPFILGMLGPDSEGINGNMIPVEIEIITEACTMIDTSDPV